MSNFKVEGIEDLQGYLDGLITEYPKTAKNKVNQIARDLKKNLASASPATPDAHKKKLCESWKNKTEIINKSDIYGYVYSNAPHFHLINRGHVIAGKHGRIKGFSPGLHYLEKTVAEFCNNELDEKLHKLVEAMIRKDAKVKRGGKR